MYAVVGCSDCRALWVIEGRADTLTCPRCGSARAWDKRRKFLTTEDRDHAREVRASMLAARQDEADAFADLDHVGDLEDRIDEAGPDDETYLAASGVDPEAAAEAGERATGGEGGSTSRRETVQAAIRDLEDPTAEDVVDYAAARGVPESYVRDALEKLVERGHATQSGGAYRLL